MSPRTSTSLVIALGLVACETDPQAFLVGGVEPVRVLQGTFHAGPLPENAEAATPLVSNASSLGTVVTQGQGSVAYQGLASPDTYAINIAFDGFGTGYWTVPVDGPDVTANNQLTFAFDAAIGREAPYGIQALSIAPVNASGEPGPAYASTLCVLPENASSKLTACDPTVSPPARVLSLTWDTAADLDLRVETPDGRIVDAKAPATLWPDEDGLTSADLAEPSVGRLSRDSNAGCVQDGIRRESLVFPGEPMAGTYTVYVRLASLCGARAVTWNLERLQRGDAVTDTAGDIVAQPVERTLLAQGQLLAVHATGTDGTGTLAAAVELP